MVTAAHGMACSREPDLRKQGGFSLIEVLIALIILSVGLIGIAALTVVSLQSVNSSLYTSIASSIALDLEERLWLAVAEKESGCPTTADVNALLVAARAQWTSQNAAFLRLPPNSDIAIGSIGTPPVGVHQSASSRTLFVPLLVTWPESRFGGLAEEFAYTATVHCRKAP